MTTAHPGFPTFLTATATDPWATSALKFGAKLANLTVIRWCGRRRLQGLACDEAPSVRCEEDERGRESRV